MPEEPAFAAPWQAQAFALVLALQDAGVFTAAEWSHALGAERATAPARPDGTDDVADWVATLARLLAAKGITDDDEVDALTAAWQRAAHATPHGRPIELANDPCA